MLSLKGLSEMTRKRIASAQKAHRRHVKEADARARIKLAKARTELERRRIREEQKLAKVRAEREFYEAKIAVQREKEAAARTRRESGTFTPSERVARFGRGAERLIKRSVAEGEKAYRGLVSNKPRRRVVRRRTAKRR